MCICRIVGDLVRFATLTARCASLLCHSRSGYCIDRRRRNERTSFCRFAKSTLFDSGQTVSTTFVGLQWGNGSHCRECLKNPTIPRQLRGPLCPFSQTDNTVRAANNDVLDNGLLFNQGNTSCLVQSPPCRTAPMHCTNSKVTDGTEVENQKEQGTSLSSRLRTEVMHHSCETATFRSTGSVTPEWQPLIGSRFSLSAQPARLASRLASKRADDPAA